MNNCSTKYVIAPNPPNQYKPPNSSTAPVYYWYDYTNDDLWYSWEGEYSISKFNKIHHHYPSNSIINILKPMLEIMCLPYPTR